MRSDPIVERVDADVHQIDVAKRVRALKFVERARVIAKQRTPRDAPPALFGSPTPVAGDFQQRAQPAVRT